MNENKKISVIIRCRNESRWIGHTIQSVIDLVNAPEIVVIDNHSTDSSVEIAKNFQRDPELRGSNAYTDIKIITIDEYTPGRSINMGAKEAVNEYLLVISGHCVLNKIDLNKHISDLESYDAIFGNQIPIWQGKKITKRYIWSHFIDSEVTNMFSEMENRYFFHNAISFFKKETLIKYPFDANLTGKEDRYWANEMINNGSKILYDPSMEADHHYTDNGNTWKGIG